jgi:hypothetical protein
MAIKPEGGTAALMNKSNVISNSRYDPLEGARDAGAQRCKKCLRQPAIVLLSTFARLNDS